jgi:hypothetical protein
VRRPVTAKGTARVGAAPSPGNPANALGSLQRPCSCRPTESGAYTTQVPLVRAQSLRLLDFTLTQPIGTECAPHKGCCRIALS